MAETEVEETIAEENELTGNELTGADESGTISPQTIVPRSMLLSEVLPPSERTQALEDEEDGFRSHRLEAVMPVRRMRL